MYHLTENKEVNDIHGSVNFVTELNLVFYEYTQMHEECYICDISYLFKLRIEGMALHLAIFL